MKLIIAKDYKELSTITANIITKAISEKPNLNLGLATGSTPIGVYAELSSMHKNEGFDFSEIRTFNLDEYVGLSKTNKQSYHYFMYDHLFNHINVPDENINLLDGMANDLDVELSTFIKKIISAGGIDLQIDGLGENGHIGFNEPDTSLKLNANVAPLSKSTIQANSRFFENLAEVPTHAMTLGMADILSAKKIVIMVNGEHKAKAVRDLLRTDVITTQNPSTLLHLHPDVTLIVDQEAAKLL